MKQIRPENLISQTNAIENEGQSGKGSNASQAVKRLRLTTVNDQSTFSDHSFDVNLTSFTELRLEMSATRINLPGVVNEIFDLVSQFFSNFSAPSARINLTNESNNANSLDSFLK